MNVQQALKAAYDYCIAFNGRCEAINVVEWAMKEYPRLFFQESDRLITQASLRQAKAIMKAAEPSMAQEDVESENQLHLPLGNLPGMQPPRTLVVETAKRTYCHVRYDVATWADLEGALEQKEKNITHAILRRDDHLRKMDALAPYMKDRPERTVGEACELMKKEPPAGAK